MEGLVDLSSRLYAEMVYLPARPDDSIVIEHDNNTCEPLNHKLSSSILLNVVAAVKLKFYSFTYLSVTAMYAISQKIGAIFIF